ncbi:lysozyme [Dyella sp. SG562]|uniref:lysozyme n=1 Tax=Dyella TaxID=231454 RepID=UPI0017A76DB3|nr:MULTISPECIES: lysozyme [unclassified Dyella]NII73509.1 lysozyme [Dyella sp. SG562]NKJ23003.1 lysozyme [Dyella sp. SG609]
MNAMGMHTSALGVALIKQFEGLRTCAYLDAAGIWTIGYGHTGDDVRSGFRIDAAQADALLRKDLGTAEEAVRAWVTQPLAQPSFDALVSFVFNVGATAFAGSTLLRKLNEGDMEGAAAEFERWRYAGGRVLPGLLRRRIAERTLFLSPHPAGVALRK